jgi:hypothetical protein
MIRHIIGIAAVALLLSGCARGPETVVETFHEAVASGNYDRAIDQLSPGLVEMFGRDKLKKVLAQQTDTIASCGGIANIDSQIDGETDVRRGTVTVTYKGQCEPRVEKVKLLKVSGEWRIGADK